MKPAWIVCVAMAALAMPAVSPAVVSQTDFKNAASFLKALRTDLGVNTFKQTFGTNKNKSNGYGKCVSKHARTMDEVHSDAVKGVQGRARGGRSCIRRPSTEATRTARTRWGECVSSQVQGKLSADPAGKTRSRTRPSRCKAERKA